MQITEYIYEWVKARYPHRYWDCVTDDLINTMAGDKTGNNYEQRAVKEIMAAYKKYRG